ncbi:MAG: PAN domain-containing protein [Alphaproteobacteria bacterium]|nr:PAN domain-containing protein [Alphaproteobacteria bacterium]
MKQFSIIVLILLLIGAGVFVVIRKQNPAMFDGTSLGGSISHQASVSKPQAAAAFRLERGFNRHASDYRDFEMAANEGLEVCQKACADDSKCRAFTMVQAGVQGKGAHCWLKSTVPPGYPDERCVSGVKA